MNSLGNIFWLLLGGIIIALIYYVVGLLMCITIIGIPFGVQLFKLGTYALWPFGRELVNGPNEPGCLSVLMNLVWILLGWWEIAILHLFFGLLFCITIVGIPFGIKHFRLAIANFFPVWQEDNMRVVVQRVSSASVTIDGMVKSSIGHEDDETDIDYLVKKTAALRIFNDEDGVMNRSVMDVDGEVIVVRQSRWDRGVRGRYESLPC